MPTPFEILGVSPDASSEEIGQAFRTLAHIYHPDRLEKANDEVRAEAVRRMFEVNTAYEEILSTSFVNVDYDTEGWSNQQRANVTKALLDSGIDHEWEGSSLLVSPDDEEAADAILYA